jgi:hypothetical membrane protein
MALLWHQSDSVSPGATEQSWPSVNAWLLVCAGAIPVLTIASWAIAGALQPARYSPLRQSVSVLAGYGGTDRWIVTGGLIGAGVCYLILAQALTILDQAARIGLVVAGLSAIGIALCPEPSHGSTPQHLAFTALGGVVIAMWPAVVGRSAQTPILTPRVSTAGFAICSALAIWTFVETRTDDVLGLAERLSSSAAICWPLVVVLALHHATRHPVAVPAPPDDRTVERAHSACTKPCESTG